MPEFDRLEKGFDPTEGQMNSETEQSVKMLCDRLDTQTSDELSPRQIELYFPGAVWIKHHLEDFPQYANKIDFIDSIIDSNRTADIEV